MGALGHEVRYRLRQFRNNLGFTSVVICILAVGIVTNSSTSGTARQEFEKGESARKTGDFATAATAYRKAIEIDPAFTKAHEQFILTTMWAAAKALKHPESKETKEKDDDKAKAEQDKLIVAAMVRVRKELTEQYRQQANAQPDKAVYQWAMGFINVENDPQAAEAYYRAALKIDSRFAPAHGQIAILERDRGAVGDALEDMRQAVEDDPSRLRKNSIRRVEVPQNSLVSTTQPDKKKACAEKTSSSWMCSATSAPSSESPQITPCVLFVT